jgi:carbon monoxide dehydrogenase subunit G
MTDIQSESIVINNPEQTLFNFLSDFNHFGKLMPEQVINWQSTRDECSFTIKGMADLSMKIESSTPFSNLKYVSKDDKPFGFSLIAKLGAKDINSTVVQFVLSADLNPFLKMMAVRPLQNFVNLLAGKLKEIAEKPV